MDIKFHKFSDFKRGTFFDLLVDAYSFDKNIVERCIDNWRRGDEFFYNNLEVADSCGFVTTLNDEAIGFICWDPRHMPEYAIIGDNCIASKHKGNGYGKLQLQEAIDRIAQKDVSKIFVSTEEGRGFKPARRMYESVGFERLDAAKLQPWQVAQGMDVYYVLEVRL